MNLEMALIELSTLACAVWSAYLQRKMAKLPKMDEIEQILERMEETDAKSNRLYMRAYKMQRAAQQTALEAIEEESEGGNPRQGRTGPLKTKSAALGRRPIDLNTLPREEVAAMLMKTNQLGLKMDGISRAAPSDSESGGELAD